MDTINSKLNIAFTFDFTKINYQSKITTNIQPLSKAFSVRINDL
jgi:hypothetical protein